MARIRKAEEPQFTPGTPEFTMAQEQRRQARKDALAFASRGFISQEEELREMYQTLLDLSISPELSSSERQEVDDLMNEFDQSGYGMQEASFGGVGRAIGGAFKSPRAQKILGGIRQAPGVLRDKALALANRFGVGKGKAAAGSKSGAKGDAGDFGTSGFADDIAGARRAKAASDRKAAAEAAERKAAGIAKGKKTRARNIANKGLRKGAPVTGPVGLGGAAYMTSQLMDGEEPPQPREYLGPYSPEYYSDLPLVPMPTETSPEEPQPGLQRPMPGQEEEPEGPEDTRTPMQKRKFLPRYGGQGSQGRLRRNPRYVPPPGGEEADPESAQRPELPMTGVPGEQPEAIPDMTPTDQDIEGLFNGQGMPERFQDDPSRYAASVAFRRERDKAFGRPPDTSMEGAPGVYEESEGVDFINTPEGQALLQNRMTPMSPEEQAPPGGIDPLTPTPRMPASPTFETPGMTPRIPPQMPLPETGPTPSPDQRIQDLPRLMPELGRQMRPEVPSPESPEDRIEEDPTLIKEDVLDDLATMRPQDAGLPTDDDIVGLFEGRNVPVSQLSQEEMEKELAEINARLEEQPNLPLTEEDEKRFIELLERTRT